MATRYPDSKNIASVEQGNEFQDFVMDALRIHCGILVQCYTSKKYQVEQGENPQGIEIKLDNWCSRSNRLSIEIAGRTSLTRDFIPSGIYRRDNTWLYIQGNFIVLYVFAKTTLQLLHKTGRYTAKAEPTVQAFYLPDKDARRYAAKVIDFPKD